MAEKKEIDRAKLGKRNRQKGHDAERRRAGLFRLLGYPFCKTSRAASRLLDNCKVDLAFIPYNVQIKAVKSGLNYEQIFEEMKTLLEANFPPGNEVLSYPSVIFHDRGRKESQKHVIMQEKDFMELLKVIAECQKNQNLKN